MVVVTGAMLYCLFHQTISLSLLPAAFVLRNPVETIFFYSGEWSQQALKLEQIKPEDRYVELAACGHADTYSQASMAH